MTLLHLRIDLLDGLEAHTDDDEDRGAAEREVLVGVQVHQRQGRDHRDEAEVQRTGCRETGEHIRQVVLRGLSGSYSRDEAAVLLHVVSLLGRIELHRHIEVGEEDDEDEKPLVNGASLGTTVPNEQLLQQWSQAMFGSVPTDETMQTQPFRDSESVWPSVGPVFSTVSTSSESEDDSERVHKTPQTSRFSSYTPHQAMYRDGSGAMGAYGFMPASSQGSAMSTNMSTDSESRRSSAVSMSISESEAGGQDATGNRSPSIRRTAQVVDPTTDAQPSPSSPAQPAIRPRRSSSRNRRQEEVESSSATMGPPSSESSSQDGEGDGDSDYEQTHHVAQPVSRSVPRRGRPPRTISGHNKTHGSGSHHSLSTSPTSHGLPRRNASPPASGSVIRCEYVSPVTRQMCGTVFHRMYDLARHRITLHVREEAQLVKEGVLKVDQCVVLGKEVDVEKALSDLEWTCRICGASFSRKDAMLRHERLRHHA